MIEINLHPNASKKKAPRRQSVDIGGTFANVFSRVRDKWLIGTAIVTVGTLGAAGMLYYGQMQREQDLRARLDAGIKDSTRYATLIKDRIHAEAVRDTLLRQVNLIKTIDEDRFIWPHVMDEVARALPPYTWLTEMAPAGGPVPADSSDTTTKALTFKISGRTVDIQAYTRFLRQLEASPWVKDVTPLSAMTVVENERAVTAFTITATFHKADSAYIRTVALSQSVR
jgi:Tfp pilus assembly protein PilN